MIVRNVPLISFIAAPRVLGSKEATTIVTRGDPLSGVLASINASFFTRAFATRGHTVSSGIMWKNSQRLSEGPTLACNAIKQCQIVHQPPAEMPGDWTDAASGVYSLVIAGHARTAVEDQACKTFCETSHPRTAVGLDASGRWMYWLAAEGRKKSVVGLSLSKLANLMKDAGIADAINLDGGGSTALHVLGNARTARPDNEPQPRKIANAWVVLDGSTSTNRLATQCQHTPQTAEP